MDRYSTYSGLDGLKWQKANISVVPIKAVHMSVLYSSHVVQHRVSHQALWLGCVLAPSCPLWRSVSGARLPLVPGLFAAPLGFDSPAVPLNCFPWWMVRAVMMAGQRSAASRCVLCLYCYDCQEREGGKSKWINKSQQGCYYNEDLWERGKASIWGLTFSTNLEPNLICIENLNRGNQKP